MTTHADLAEVADHRIVADWALGEWADRLLEQAGLGVTILDRHGMVMYYNKWASEHLDRQPAVRRHAQAVRRRPHRAGAVRGPAVRENHHPGDGFADPDRRRARWPITARAAERRSAGTVYTFRRHGPRIVRTRDAAQRLPGRVTVVEICTMRSD